MPVYNLFYKFANQNGVNLVAFDEQPSAQQFHDEIASQWNIPFEAIDLFHQGKKIPHNDEEQALLQNGSAILICPTGGLPGGKGGFGSMLRAIGAKIEKTTNQEACRDLSGRRLRDINEERRIRKWIQKQAQMKAEKDKRKKEKLEKMRAKLEPKFKFEDPDYDQARHEIPEMIDDAVEYALNLQRAQSSTASASLSRAPDESSSSSGSELLPQPSTSGLKRAAPSQPSRELKKSKHTLWLGVDEELSSESETEESKQAGNESVPSQSQVENSSSSQSVTDFPPQSEEEPMAKVESTSAQSDDSSQCSSSPDSSKENQPQELITLPPAHPLQTNALEVGINNLENAAISKPQEDKAPQEKIVTISEPIELMNYNSIEEIEILGLERLKNALIAEGLKCGGTLKERASRLWAIRGLDRSQYPKQLLAKK